jgi:hypothetical protein
MTCAQEKAARGRRRLVRAIAPWNEQVADHLFCHSPDSFR